MGWPSMLENAIERFYAQLQEVKRERSVSPSQADGERLVEMKKLLGRGEAILAEALTLLDVATDPAIDAALALKRARDENTATSARLHEYERTCVSLKRQLDIEREKALKAEAQAEQLMRELARANARIEEMMRVCPEAVYAAYDKGSKSKLRRGEG